MNIEKNLKEQSEKIKGFCIKNGISFEDMILLLESVKTKKLLRRNNYHQQKINDVIEKSTQ